MAPVSTSARITSEVDDVLGELETLLKHPEAGATFAERGVNISLALLLVDGVRAYLNGDRARAAEDLGDAAHEIASRMNAAKD